MGHTNGRQDLAIQTPILNWAAKTRMLIAAVPQGATGRLRTCPNLHWLLINETALSIVHAISFYLMKQLVFESKLIEPLINDSLGEVKFEWTNYVKVRISPNDHSEL